MSRLTRATGPRPGPRLLAGTLAVAAALLSLAIGSTPAAAGARADRVVAGPTTQRSYIVRAAPGEMPAVAARLTRLGGRTTGHLRLINAVVCRLPAAAASALRRDPRVTGVTADSRLTLLSTAASAVPVTYDPAADPNSLYNLERLIGVPSMWGSGYTGLGIDVALLDSGVAPVTGLSDAGKILNGPDLTPESQNSATRYLDTFGHGTHMAGLIAGRDPGVNAAASINNSAPFLGVAPGARIVSIKVADAHGATDVSQVIAGIDWAVQHAHDPGLNIRVLNLSFGTNSPQGYLYDPLAYAAEVAWRKGIVVVAAAGNSGFADGRLADPALDPFVLAVGADDTHGTSLTLDDTIPSFSSRGTLLRSPDVVAPGVHVQSLRVPASYIDQTYGGTGQINDRFFRGSGTSQATAIVSGAVALLLQQRPWLTPDQAKYVVKSLVLHLLIADPRAQGSGLINLGTSSLLGLVPIGLQLATPAVGTGSIEQSRGTNHLILDGISLTGEQDLFGHAFNSSSMAALELSRTSWSGGTWNGSVWTGAGWSGYSVPTAPWTGRTWAGGPWTGRTWATGYWDGRTWADTNWSSSSWSGFGWTGRTWAGTGLAGSDWQ